ncbi:MAG: tetratricopeptide repeat protein, partial [Anaerolineae bacterium]|nr:tetratricopeptide repeat protein [Anaerolineae bacterium]
MNQVVRPVPQTGRMAPPLAPAEVARLLAMHHKEDLLDLFANDPDKDIRQLGQLALRRSPPDVDDAFALGDLCADRVLLDDQLRVFYVGKAITAYRRAASRAANDVDLALAEQALAYFVAWVCEAALALPSARNVAVALWAAAEIAPEDQPNALQQPLIDLLQAYPVGLESGFTLDRPVAIGFDATQAADGPGEGILDTQDEYDPNPAIFSNRRHSPDLGTGSPASPAVDSPNRPEGAFSAMDLRPGSRPAPALPRQEHDEFVQGERIEDRYEVAQVLRGGMGVVYLCYDHEQRAPVAIKSFQSRFFGNERAVARFEQEALVWVRLEKHPNIVQARLVKTIQGRPHIFLEHVSGPEGLGADLRSWIDHNRIRLPQAVTFAYHVARAMQHATAKVPGLVHRDLKPANILVSHDEVAKVTDFGLVRSVESVDVPLMEEIGEDPGRLTVGGAVVGTVPYMSPEQCRAEEVDLRSDIYAFGCILYEMLAGRPVFGAQKFHTWITAHLTEVPEIPPDVAIDIPGALGELVLACLAKDSADRPQSWGDLVDDLGAIYTQVVGEPPVFELSEARMEAHELMDKGYSLTELGRAEEALDAYDAALALQPDYAWAWARKGRTLRLLRRYPEALEAFDRAIEFSPDYGWAWNGKGIVLERMQQDEAALEAYRRAAVLKPHDVWPLYNQADILQSLNHYDQALPLLDQALKIDPMHAHSWAKRGQIFRLINQNEDAVKAYGVALKFQPDYGWASNGLGLALKALGRPSEALVAFRNAARDAPDEVWHWYNQVEMLVDLGRYEEALIPARQAVRVDPEHAYSWAKLAQVCRYLNHHDEALEAYDRALALNPDYGWAWNG